jgi:hypothetical protein
MSHPKQIRLAGSVLGPSRHVCTFFHSKDEEYRVLLPYIKEGFEQGDRAFHLSKFSASLIMDAMRVHAAVIIGGTLQENPFYVPPDEFLRELREGAGQNAAGVC